MEPSDAKYSNVEYIVVDPSCSGSGIVNRMDKLVDEAQGTSEKKVTTPNKLYNISQVASTRQVIGQFCGPYFTILGFHCHAIEKKKNRKYSMNQVKKLTWYRG